jgi:hypothetical protein
MEVWWSSAREKEGALWSFLEKTEKLHGFNDSVLDSNSRQWRRRVQNFEAVACKGFKLFQGQIKNFYNFQGHERESRYSGMQWKERVVGATHFTSLRAEFGRKFTATSVIYLMHL